MPYIPKEDRPPIDEVIDQAETALRVHDDDIAGRLNYLISSLCARVLDRRGVNYNNINATIGVLQATQLEMYRRLAAPYEDKKKDLNGDVFVLGRDLPQEDEAP